MSSQIIQSYAGAFSEMANEENKVAKFVEEVAMLTPIFKDTEVMNFFKSPVYSAADKETVVAQALGSASLDPVMSDFIKLLAKNGRLHLFPQIMERFRGLSTGETGLRGEILMGEELTATEKSNIQKAIEKKLGATVIADFKLDANLGAGVEARVGSYLIEDSIRSNLQKMGESLKRSSN